MKKSIGWLGGFSILLLVVALSAASAQQKGKGGGGFRGGFGGNSMATIAGFEAVQKEIGVSGDVAGKLNSLRDDMNAARQKEFQQAGINPQDFQNQTQETRQKMTQIGNKLNEEFDPKVKALLSADQLKRLQQIRFQAAWQTQGPPALLMPEAASELKLSDEQRQKLNALTMEYAQKQRELFTGGFDPAAAAKMREERTAKATELLTAEQKEKLKSLEGSPFDIAQLGGMGGRRGKGN
jgi:hypothetical protein